MPITNKLVKDVHFHGHDGALLGIEEEWREC